VRSALTKFARAEAVEGHASAGGVRVHHGRVLPAHRHVLMLAYAALTGGLSQFSLGADRMLAGLWGGASLLLAALTAAAALCSAKRQGQGRPVMAAVSRS
jgi:hypothetical protein